MSRRPFGPIEVCTITPKISIIVVSYNTRALTLDCLRSIYEQTARPLFELIVVDNASSDGSPEAIGITFPDVILIANSDNRGFAAANNQGLKLSKGDYVLLLNPDTIILDDAIDRMVRYMDAHPDVGCAGCQVLENERTIQRTCFRFPSPINELFHVTGLARVFPRSQLFGRYAMGWWDRKSERDVDVVSGMFLIVRREALQQIGFMDESYFVYAEEADWCWQLRRLGWRCVFTPIARIIHRDGGGQSAKCVSTRMYVQLQKSVLIFIRKNRGRAAWIAAKAIYAVAMIARCCLMGVAAVVGRSDRLRLKAQQAAAAVRFHWLGVEPNS